jgi:diguanylate cyclase (GGDEF)-like protein
MGITELVSRQPKQIVTLFGLVLLAGVAGLDYVARREALEISILYLIPISFFTWFRNNRWSIPIAAGSAAWALRAGLGTSAGAIAYWNALILLGLYLGAVAIITELKTLYLRERDLSRIDALTNLPNRRAFYEMAVVEASRSRRYREPLTLAYFDLDEFKQIDDRFGHLVGDSVLARVAKVTRSCLRRSDVAARIGGDEFALLLPATDPQTAEKILERLQTGLREAMQRNRWPVTFSIGAVTFDRVPATVEEMIARADEAMYAVKLSGKNRIEQRQAA